MRTNKNNNSGNSLLFCFVGIVYIIAFLCQTVVAKNEVKSTLQAIRSSSCSNELIVPISIKEYLFNNTPIQRSELTDLLFFPGNDKLMKIIHADRDSLMRLFSHSFESVTPNAEDIHNNSKIIVDSITFLPEIIIDGHMGRIGLIGDSVIFQTTKIIEFKLSKSEYNTALSIFNKINCIYIRTNSSISNEELEIEHPVAIGDHIYFVANGKVLLDCYDPLEMNSIKLCDKNCAIANFIRYIYGLCTSR